MKEFRGTPARYPLTAALNDVDKRSQPEQEADRIVDRLVRDLEENGIAVLPALFTTEQIRDMRRAFEAPLRGMRWNDLDGYEKEPLREVIQDVLTVEQGFVDLAIHPFVAKTLARYLGTDFALTEAKGWKSLITKRDFQGWHGDYWYDETKVSGIAKEVKLAMYLTDVRSGAFNYIKGSHQRQHPRLVENNEVRDVPQGSIQEVVGPAGTAFLFDSSGIHKQGVPILEPRLAVFYNYHDPKVQLAKEALDYYRYHPLVLNAAFLGGLSEEAQRILGFGNKIRYIPAFRRTTKYKLFYKTFEKAFAVMIAMSDLRERVGERLSRVLKRKG
jgi:hypothetical protein